MRCQEGEPFRIRLVPVSIRLASIRSVLLRSSSQFILFRSVMSGRRVSARRVSVRSFSVRFVSVRIRPLSVRPVLELNRILNSICTLRLQPAVSQPCVQAARA